MEVRRSVTQVDEDVRLLRHVAAELSAKYRDSDLARQVDALADDLYLELCHAGGVMPTEQP